MDLLKDLTFNMVVQGVIALVAVTGTFLLVAAHQEVPDIVKVVDGAVIGFYFANSQTAHVARAVTRAINGAVSK